jgi:hypothetical protein
MKAGKTMTQRLRQALLIAALLTITTACASPGGLRERKVGAAPLVRYVLVQRARDQGKGVSATYPLSAYEARALTLEVLRVWLATSIASWRDKDALIQDRPVLDSDQAIIAAVSVPIFGSLDATSHPVALGVYVSPRDDRQSDVVVVSQVRAFWGYKQEPLAERQFHEALAAALKTRAAAGAGSSSKASPAGLATTLEGP